MVFLFGTAHFTLPLQPEHSSLPQQKLLLQNQQHLQQKRRQQMLGKGKTVTNLARHEKVETHLPPIWVCWWKDRLSR